MKLEVVKIPSGDVTLAALRYVPEPQSKTTGLVYVHGFTSGKYSLDNLASYLALRGYAGLTFDCVGHKLGCTGGEMWHITQAADNLRDGHRRRASGRPRPGARRHRDVAGTARTLGKEKPSRKRRLFLHLPVRRTSMPSSFRGSSTGEADESPGAKQTNFVQSRAPRVGWVG